MVRGWVVGRRWVGGRGWVGGRAGKITPLTPFLVFL